MVTTMEVVQAAMAASRSAYVGAETKGSKKAAASASRVPVNDQSRFYQWILKPG